MTTFLFPGQGSQTVGMGKELFDRYDELVQQADQVLGYSIKALCLEDTQRRLMQTQYTQPALYTVNALSYLTKQQKPSFCAGHSLGEYNALFAAKVFDFITGLQLVKYRGELMQQAQNGGMAAVIGLTEQQLQLVLSAEGFETIDIANINEMNQIVISGPQKDIELIQPYLNKAGAKLVIPLKVSGAFHSRYMQVIQDSFNRFLTQFTFQTPCIEVIANINARPYTSENIVDNLTQQLTHPVRWLDSILYLIARKERDFQEIGPGTVLTNIVQRILMTEKASTQ